MASKREKCKLWCQLEAAVATVITSKIGANGTAGGTTAFVVGTWGNGAEINANNEFVTFPSTTDYMPAAGTLEVECNPVGWNVVNGETSDAGLAREVWCMYGTAPNTRYWFLGFGSAGFGGFVAQITANGSTITGFVPPVVAPLMDAAGGSKNSLVHVWNTAGIDGGANTEEIYWNGVLVASTTNVLVVPTESRSAWYLGNHPTLPASNRDFHGVLDNVKVFNAALRDRALGAHRVYEGWLMDERKGGGHVVA